MCCSFNLYGHALLAARRIEKKQRRFGKGGREYNDTDGTRERHNRHPIFGYYSEQSVAPHVQRHLRKQRQHFKSNCFNEF